MRIGGIASGMDTEQMVRDLMRAERVRMDRFFQQEQRLKWRQEAYNGINRSMANFIVDSRKSFGLARTTATGSMINTSASSFDWVKRATSSNEGVVRATANANAMAGTHTVKVEQLAEVASVTSGDLKGLLEADGRTFKAGSHEFTIATATGHQTFKIGNEDDAIKNMDDLVRAINSATSEEGASLGLRSAYDRDLGQLMINTRETGKEQFITIKDVSKIEGVSPWITFTTKSNEPVDEGVEIKGQDAEITFNGSVIEKSTNNFSVYGINLQLQSEQVAEAQPITIRVDADVDSIFDKVKSFVDEYNKLLDEINGQLGQKHYRDFSPLTNEQKEAMSEKDIELWEEKAKSGLIRNDSILTRTLQTIRSSLYEKVEGVSGSYDHITQLGITTGTYQEGGKLVINEEKLRAAINDDPEGVIDLMFKSPDSSLTGKEKMENTGLVQRIYDGMIDGIKEIVHQSGPGEDSALLRNVRSNILIDFVTGGSRSVLDKDLNSINTRMAREEDLLRRREDRYWQQFTAMEKALASMHQQSSWLMSQMGQQF
ncbi:flagellar hook-associated protein 2 [Natronincola ferrireducens]|uniref:Flagellar hook-associated protein 2 n=2 Tax=Natronincola ferrireducens TaxID=393762 RepID=A0A1G8XSQ9_9FIRM|nr:flagellar hook-associated protein 2 [Natronincola ferrireducens]